PAVDTGFRRYDEMEGGYPDPANGSGHQKEPGETRLAGRGGLAAVRGRGDLGDQLAGDRLREVPEIVDREQKRPGPADHVLLEIFGQTARRLGVKGVARVGLGVDDRQSVDRDAGGNRLVARLGDGTAGIVGAVA